MLCDDFGTHDLPADTQLEAWQSWYGAVFDTSPLERGDKEFFARNQSWKLNGLALNCVSAPGLSMVRTKALIRREPVDHWAITVGQCVTKLDFRNGSLDAPAGVPYVASLGQEMRNQREGDKRIQLYLARDTFYQLAPLLDDCCMSAFQTPGGKLFADYMRLLMLNLSNLDHSDASRLVDATGTMLAACFSPSHNRVAAARPIINMTLMERVRKAVRNQLRSPTLGPDTICKNAATSRSQLYRLLQGEGGVAHYIQKLRLSEAFSLLSDGSRNDSILAISEALCFSDASSFARAFRRQFGVSPSDVRAAAQAGLSPPHASVADDGLGNTSFAHCLRSA